MATESEAIVQQYPPVKLDLPIIRITRPESDEDEDEENMYIGMDDYWNNTWHPTQSTHKNKLPTLKAKKQNTTKNVNINKKREAQTGSANKSNSKAKKSHALKKSPLPKKKENFEKDARSPKVTSESSSYNNVSNNKTDKKSKSSKGMKSKTDESLPNSKSFENDKMKRTTRPFSAPQTKTKTSIQDEALPKRELSQNAEEYAISGPRGQDLYDQAPPPLPPLNNPPPMRRSRSKSVLQPYIQGGRSVSAVNSVVNTPRSERGPRSSKRRSKDDSRIQYELQLEDHEFFRNLADRDPWHPRTIRVFRNGDRYYPGYDYTFKPGRDVLNLEGLCDKISDRIGLVRGARYIYGLDGTRRYRLEELEDGESYVAASDRKFINLAYGKIRPSWRQGNTPNWSVRTRNEDPTEAQKSSADSNKSNSSGGGKPGSREGRTITVINQLDHSQERSVLVNLKTVQAWEDVVADLGQVLRMRGTIILQTPWGQDVKSFSQFNNDFASVETFYLVPLDGTMDTPTPPSSAAENPGRGGRRMVDPTRKGVRVKRGASTNLRRFTSEPSLNGVVGALDDQVEIASGRSAVVEIKGTKKVLLAPRRDVLHNPHHPSHMLELDWVYGYRGWDTRKNLWVLKSGEMLYFVATIAVLYDRTDDHQRHYTGHTEDIQCMALHPNGVVVASGQRASHGHRLTASVHVWDSRSLRTLHVLGEGDLGVGILALDFSPRNNGEFLLAVDGDREHLLSVWFWAKQGIFGRVATHEDHVWGAAFHPLDNNLIVTHGRGLLAVWSRRKDGIFTRTDLLK
ncbi:Doublecortin domain, partial [Trinorchestia longiramus]